MRDKLVSGTTEQHRRTSSSYYSKISPFSARSNRDCTGVRVGVTSENGLCFPHAGVLLQFETAGNPIAGVNIVCSGDELTPPFRGNGNLRRRKNHDG
jgi:hypothetical protein